MKHLQWVVTAAASAYACYLAVHHATPIDRALPFIAVAVVAVASMSHLAVLLAVPMLVLAEIAIRDEGVRLFTFGAIVAAAVVVAVVNGAPASGRRDAGAPFVAIAAVLLLRWIPFEHVLLLRELFLLAVAVAIVFVLGRTPFAVAVAVIATLVTPAVPLRTLALPLIVLFVAILARTFGMPRVRLTLPSAVLLGFVMLFFAWSGIVARAFPYFLLRDARPVEERYTVNAALLASQSAELWVPPTARALIVSGANVPRFRRGALLGRIEPGGIDLRIGDAADWGYMRREHFYGTRNPLPRDPAGQIRGYGYAAWVDGAGRVPLPRGARTIRVTAAPDLPPGASLQVEGFEIATR